MKQLIIIGAGGHGKVVADIAEKNGYEKIIFLDDNYEFETCSGYEVAGKSDDIDNYDCDFFVAIGSAKIRKMFIEKLEKSSKNIPTLIHPNAVVGKGVNVGNGSVIMAGAVVNADAALGKGVIINTCASVDHDCKIKDYVHVSVGAHIAGTVDVGENTWVGAGATVINNISICPDCMIGAGAVVIKDIETSGTYIGVPARRK